jgi:hypothetical protein
VSAEAGTGVDELRAAIEARLPESPFYYPADDLAVQPVRFFVAELIRETIFELYEQEVPYSTIARVEEFREAEEPVYIRATVYVERERRSPSSSAKAARGSGSSGRRSREKIELFLDQRVYLDLWIKVLPNWRAGVETLRYLGYRLPPSMAAAEHADQGLPGAAPGRAVDSREETDAGSDTSRDSRLPEVQGHPGVSRGGCRAGLRDVQAALRGARRYSHHAHRRGEASLS